MSDLAAWLLAQIEADEATARAAGEGEWFADHREVYRSSPIQVLEIVTEGRSSDMPSGCESPEIAAHIATHDPARVLAECEAKRRIVEMHAVVELKDWRSLDGGYPTCTVSHACETCGTYSEYPEAWPCDTLRALALPYADREGYRQEWA